jgi:hypothetical protein
LSGYPLGQLLSGMLFHSAAVIHFDIALKGATEIQMISMGYSSNVSVYHN